MDGIELEHINNNRQSKNTKYIVADLDFNRKWKENNQEEYANEYNRLGDEIKIKFEKIGYKNIDSQDMKHMINDVVFLYIKCKDYTVNEDAIIWNNCLEKYLIDREIFNKTGKRIGIDENKIKVNRETTEHIIKRHEEQEKIINEFYDKFLSGLNYDRITTRKFIMNLAEQLAVFNNNIITYYFTDYINKVFKPSDDEEGKNWAIFTDLTAIVLTNIKRKRYGTDIYIEKEVPKIIGSGGKKTRKSRKSIKTKKSRKTKKTRKSSQKKKHSHRR